MRISAYFVLCLLAATGAALGQQPVAFACTDDAFIVQNQDAQLSRSDESTTPFTFVNIGGAAGIEYNSLGFRNSDGLLYAVELNASGSTQIIQVDSTGAVFGLGMPNGLSTSVRWSAGDITPDGTTMYIGEVGENSLYKLDLETFTVTSVLISGGTGNVNDWAVSPLNGLLYGGDRTDGELATLDPASGSRIDLAVAGLPDPDDGAYGGAWFNAAGQLFLYHSAGVIYEIDVSVPQIVSTQNVLPASNYDAAACVLTWVSIDVKPGDSPNCINNNGHGVVPVAVLGSENFDVTDIVVDDTLVFASLTVGMKGNGNLRCSVEDVSGDFTEPTGAPDGWPDLVCQFTDKDGTWEAGSHYACVLGNLEYGPMFVGCDTVCITQ